MYYSLNSIILSRRAFREDDLLLTVYSQERGKLTLLANGAKKIKSKLAGHLEPVSWSYLNVVAGRSIDQIIGAQLIKSYAQLKNDEQKIFYASYFLELIDLLIHPNHPDRRIFLLIEKYLDFLEQGSAHYEIARLSAIFKLLALLGWNPGARRESPWPVEINFIVTSRAKEIIKNQKIKNIIFELNQVAEKELAEHLPRELKTRQFLIK